MGQLFPLPPDAPCPLPPGVSPFDKGLTTEERRKYALWTLGLQEAPEGTEAPKANGKSPRMKPQPFTPPVLRKRTFPPKKPVIEINQEIVGVAKNRAQRHATFACGHTAVLLYEDKDRGVGDTALCRECWKLARDAARVEIVGTCEGGWRLSCGDLLKEGTKPKGSVIYCLECQPGAARIIKKPERIPIEDLTRIVPKVKDPIEGLTPVVPKERKPKKLSVMDQVRARGPSTVSLPVKPKNKRFSGKT